EEERSSSAEIESEEQYESEEHFESEEVAQEPERPPSNGSTEAVVSEMSPPEEVAEDIQEILEDVREDIPSDTPYSVYPQLNPSSTPQTPVAAATKIQAVYRGHAERRRFQTTRSQHSLHSMEPDSLSSQEESTDIQQETVVQPQESPLLLESQE